MFPVCLHVYTLFINIPSANQDSSGFPFTNICILPRSAPLLIACPSGIWEAHLHTPACPEPKQLQDHFSVSCPTVSAVTEAPAPLPSGPSPGFLTPSSLQLLKNRIRLLGC